MKTGVFCLNAKRRSGSFEGKEWTNYEINCIIQDAKTGELSAKTYKGKSDMQLAGVEEVEELIGREIMIYTESKVYKGQLEENIKIVMLLPEGRNINIFIEGEGVI
jgi:hypothetical protein